VLTPVSVEPESIQQHGATCSRQRSCWLSATAHHCADLEAVLDHPLPWLRYLDADAVAAQSLDFDGMDVESPTGERLGEVDGFVVDSASGRPYYIAVDSGGWFKSREFLLPVGHAQLDHGRQVIVADLTRDRVERFPGFDRDVFQKFSKEELWRFNDETCRACEVSGVAHASSETEPWPAAWDRPDFRHPDWWESTSAEPGHIGAATVTAGPGATATAEGRLGSVRHHEDAVARAAEPSPHFGGRAQPGDVLGVETGGERTHVGETTEDENDRRQDAEEAVTRRDRPTER
jgi:hypothetical protein